MAVFVLFYGLLLYIPQCSAASMEHRKQVFADVTSNKFTREHDGTWGLWSFRGVARESHASETSFIFNADKILGSHHQDIASMVYPALGLTSDLDPIYQEYLMLQAKVVGIDGFLIEWGYRDHISDQALQSYIKLAKKYADFKIAVNWCDHWLMTKLKNKTHKEIVEAFHENLQYLMDTVYTDGPELAVYFDDHPVIFLFGGGLSPDIFNEMLSIPLKLPPSVERPVWMGSYLNFVSSTTSSWSDWEGLINGTFGWAPYILKPTPPELSNWDYYGDLSDVLSYQKNVSSFGDDCVLRKKCLLWCGSVSPRFDNRGCAGWGRELRMIPETDLKTHTRFTYDVQWDYYIQNNTTTNVIVLPTMNDFPEATPVLGLNDSKSILYSTLRNINKWKKESANDSCVLLPMEWYSLYKEVEFYLMTPGLNESSLYAYLLAASEAINNKRCDNAAEHLREGRAKLNSIITGLQEKDVILPVPSEDIYPSIPPLMCHGSYLINSTSGLFLTLIEGAASTISSSNYKGFIHFQFYSLNASLNSLKIFSPTRRKHALEDVMYLSRSHHASTSSKVEGDFSEVCNLVTNSSGSWEDVTVELFRKNQSWDHTGPHMSDVHFESEGTYLVRNISLDLHLIRH